MLISSMEERRPLASRHARLALGILGTLGVSSCAAAILAAPVRGRGDAWTIEVDKVEDGPDFFCPGWSLFVLSGGCYHVNADDRMIWATVTITNEGPASRKFNFERCDLDDGANPNVLPWAVDLDSVFINWRTEKQPELDPGETITRRVLFNYPKASRATRLSCYPQEVPLPNFRIQGR